MSDPTRSCGATTPGVLGRCGRDAGHEGAHRSTGDTFEASWIDKRPAVPRLCDPDTSVRGMLDECVARRGCAGPVHISNCPEATR